MANWQAALRADPLDWLLETADPAVRHLVLRQLLDQPGDEPDVAASRREAMAADPIASILAAQAPDGHWEKPGPGYATKYRGTVWQLIFLDQLGADPENAGVRRACEYVLSHSQADNGGFGASGVASAGPPPSSRVIHCLTGNLLRALIGFGWLDDTRVVRAVERAAAVCLGCRQGPRRACAGARRAALAAHLSGDPGRRRLPPEPRSGSGRLSGGLGQHGSEQLMVQARIPVGIRGGCAPEPGGPGRVGPCSGCPSRKRDRMVTGEAGRAWPLDQRVRIQRQDLGERRATGTAQQVGDAAGLPLPPIRPGVETECPETATRLGCHARPGDLGNFGP
jgi:hypothetical protein